MILLAPGNSGGLINSRDILRSGQYQFFQFHATATSNIQDTGKLVLSNNSTRALVNLILPGRGVFNRILLSFIHHLLSRSRTGMISGLDKVFLHLSLLAIWLSTLFGQGFAPLFL